MQPNLHELHDIARRQRGLVTRSDLRRLRLSRTQRATLLRRGTLEPVGRQTFLIGGSPPDPRRELLLATLDTGGALSHRSGVALQGVPGVPEPSKPDVLVGRVRTPNDSDLATVHSTTWLPADDLTVVEGIPCTSVARSLFTLAALIPEVSEEDVRGAVDAAIQMGRATDAWLWWRLEKLRCRGRSGVANLEAILVKRAGGAVTDEELAAKAEDERASVLATITVAQWRAIRRFHQEAHLLTVAEDSPALLATTIERLVFKDAAVPPG